MGQLLSIQSLTRVDRHGAAETLAFAEGLNVIVGVPNTGKTQWLRMLDYLLGSDSKAEDAFEDELVSKYSELTAVLTVAGARTVVTRRWHDADVKGKIGVDGQFVSPAEFNGALLKRLGIKPVRYPQGDAHGPRTWPTLGWRSLLRQIYRRQDSWASIANKQFESEQHAVLLQFLGAATAIFVDEYGDLVSLENRAAALRSEKQSFQTALDMVTRELLNETDALSLTTEVIENRVAKLAEDASNVERQRSALMQGLQRQVMRPQSENEVLSSRAAVLRKRREDLTAARTDSQIHERALRRLRGKLSSELGRLSRAKVAGTVFGRLKVTHCPACDQRVGLDSPEGVCHLCHQHTEPAETSDAKRRLAREQRHIEAELNEADEVIADTTRAHAELVRELRAVNSQLAEVEAALAPVRAEFAEILPAEVQELDQRLGAIRERLRQMEGFRAALAKREDLSREIEKLNAEIAELERQVNRSRVQVDLIRLGDEVGDRMNNYLTALRSARPSSWTQREVSVELERRRTTIRVGNASWTKKLGGTMTLYFLLAYDFALLSLFAEDWTNYPGLAILDLPAKLDDGSSTADDESFVLDPFRELLGRDEMRRSQLIVTGSRFLGFQANRIELTRVWK